MTSEIKSVGVIGLGTMGAGIVEVFLKAGIPVVAVDGSSELAERGKGFLVASLDRQVKRGRLDEAGRDVLVGQATFTDQLDDLHDVDLVIEAGLQPYDIAAPMAVVEAAGGIVTDWTGGPAWNGGRVIAAATPDLHRQAMRLLADD